MSMTDISLTPFNYCSPHEFLNYPHPKSQNFSFLVFLSLFAIIAFRNLKINKRNSSSVIQENKSLSMEDERNEIGLLEKLPNSYIWVTIISSLALFLRTLFRLAETADGESFFFSFPHFFYLFCSKKNKYRNRVLTDSNMFQSSILFSLSYTRRCLRIR